MCVRVILQEPVSTLITTFISIEGAKDPFQVPTVEPIGEALVCAAGRNEDGSAGSPFGKQKPSGEGIDGTFCETSNVRNGSVSG